MAGNPPTQPRKQAQEDKTITEEIMEMLEQNGTVEPKTRDKLLLKAVKELIQKVDNLQSLDDRVERLEHRNLIALFLEHPVYFSLVTFTVFVILNIIAHSVSVWSITVAILKFLGFPTPT